jgi:hypothetical protein
MQQTSYETSDVLAFTFFTVSGSERDFAATTTQIAFQLRDWRT